MAKRQTAADHRCVPIWKRGRHSGVWMQICEWDVDNRGLHVMAWVTADADEEILWSPQSG